jgi:hypothetical protein
MKRFIKMAALLIISLIFISACGNQGKGGTKDARVINRPEVKVDYSGSSKPFTPPTIQELRWDFFKEQGKEEVVCKFKLKVAFKEEGKYNARLNFMDFNKFTVTSETIKLIGRKGEETTYEKALYIDPKISNRITKAEIFLTPLR